MHQYNQTTGEWLHGDQLKGIGYAGHGEGKNNAMMAYAPNIGPLPCGMYTIESAFTHPLKGPVCMRLTPDASNKMFGRDGFMCHGDSRHYPGTASEGCIIQSRPTRDYIEAARAAGDNRLRVISGVKS